MRTIPKKLRLLESIVFLALSLTSVFNSLAQENVPLMEPVIADPPFPSVSVDAITQDDLGFLWFATVDGLYRYDGYSNQVFKHQPSDSLSLHATSVKALLSDHKNRLWVGTTRGLNVIDLATNKVARLPVLGWILALCQDHVGRIWVGTRGNGLFVLDKEGLVINHWKKRKDVAGGLPSDSIAAIFEHKDGTKWIGTAQGIVICREDCSSMEPLNLLDATGHPPSVSAFCQDHANDLWICTKGQGVIRVNDRGEVKKWYEEDLRDPSTRTRMWTASATEDHEGTLWLGTPYFGLFRFDRSADRFYHYVHEDDRLAASFSAISLYPDRSGLIWVGTNNGVRKFNTIKTHFVYYRLSRAGKGKNLSDDVRAIVEDRLGNLWLGLDGIKEGAGLARLDRKRRAIPGSQPDPARIFPSVASIVIDRRDVLWLGSSGGGLYRFDPSTGKYRSFWHRPDDSNSISSNNIRCMVRDSDGVLWIGTLTGDLNRFDPATDRFQRILSLPKDTLSKSNPAINALFLDHTSTLWIGRGSGLIEFDYKRHTFRQHYHDPLNPKSMNSNIVYCIYEDARGLLWIGTAVGLEKYDRSSGAFTLFSEREGLANSYVNGILGDSTGNLWLSTMAGISRFQETLPAGSQFRNFSSSDGIHSGGSAFLKTSAGEFLVCGPQGVLGFFPETIKELAVPPPVAFTAFYVSNKHVSLGKVAQETDSIEVPYSANVLSFGFSALDYFSPMKNVYAYTMEGFDKEWSYAQNRHYFTYTNLDPGTYTLRVNAANSRGTWNEKGTSVVITVSPPWWRTTWAYISYVFVVIAVLFSARRYERNRQRLKQEAQIERVESEKLREFDRLKSRFFANLSHEFRTPLSLILGPLDQLESSETEYGRKAQLGLVRRNAERLLRMVNLLLQFSRIESGTLKLRVTLQEIPKLLQRVVSSFSTAAVKKGIALQSDIDPAHFEGYVDTEKVEHVLENLISNAVKYTPRGGRVIVRARRVGTELLLEISDTGPGISPEHLSHVFERFYRVDTSHQYEGTGIGLSLSKELVQMHHGNIELKSTFGAGTVATVRLPLSGYQEKEIVMQSTPSAEGRPGASEQTPASLEKPGTDNGDKTVVLVAEDNDDAREYIRTLLSPEFSVMEAVNGLQTWEMASQRIPDVVVSDVMMPEMSGYELCAKLKNDERTSHIPVILLTALADQTDKIEGLQTGADDYLVKPFDARELLVRVRNLIANRKKMQERFRSSVPLKLGEVAVTSMDDAFLKKAKDVVSRHMGDELFDVEKFASEIHLSRTQVHRKLKALTNLSATEFIRYLRLQRAKEFLEKNAGTVGEVAYLVGFSNHSYFSQSFKEQFGILPNEVLRR